MRNGAFRIPRVPSISHVEPPVRVGHAVGAADPVAARRAAGAALVLGAGFMAVCGAIFLGFPGALVGTYTGDAPVVGLAVQLVPIAGVFQVFDGLQVVATGVLRGAADTTFPAAMALVGYWLLALPTGWWLAFRAGLGARGLWWGFTVGLAAVALLLLLRIAVRFRRPLARAGAGAEA